MNLSLSHSTFLWVDSNSSWHWLFPMCQVLSRALSMCYFMSLMDRCDSCSYSRHVPSKYREEEGRAGTWPTHLPWGGIAFLEAHLKKSFYIPWPPVSIRKAGWGKGKSLACSGCLGERAPIRCWALHCPEGSKQDRCGVCLGELFWTLQNTCNADSWPHPKQ